MAKINVVQKGEEEVAPEVLAQSIVEISKAMEVFTKSRLKRDTVVTLIQARSKISKREIELVLNNLEQLADIWLKPLNK